MALVKAITASYSYHLCEMLQRKLLTHGMSVDEFYESYAVDGSIDEPALKLTTKPS